MRDTMRNIIESWQIKDGNNDHRKGFNATISMIERNNSRTMMPLKHQQLKQ
jgi:hypothetical protein